MRQIDGGQEGTRFMRRNEAVVQPKRPLVVDAQRLPAEGLTPAVVGAGAALQPQAPALGRQNTVLMTQINPALLKADFHILPFFPQAPSSVPEAEAPFAIAPQMQPTDTMIFRDGKDASKTFFLPRYRLRELPNTPGRYEIAFKAESDGLWSMKFSVETYPAQEVAEAARTSQPLPHKLAVSLRYVAANTTIEKQFPAFANTPDARGRVIEMRLRLEERDAVLRAFRSDTAQGRLVVTRLVDVCVPTPPEITTDGTVQMQTFVLKDHGALFEARRGGAIGSTFLEREMTDASSAALRLMPEGGDFEPGRRPPGKTRPPMVFSPPTPIVTRPPIVFSPPIVTRPPVPPSPPRVRTVSCALDDLVPLRFDIEAHPYLFPAGAGAAVGAEIERVQLRYPADDPNGRVHTYFYSFTKPNLFYYLPDAFKLARTLTPPFVPAMTIKNDPSQGPSNPRVALTAFLRPDVDAARLLAAKAALRAHIPASADTPSDEPELQPLQAKAVLKLGVPRSGLVQTVETDAVIDLANGFLVDEHFALPDFQDVFAALNTTGISTLFRGVVVVSTGLAAQDLIPTEIRFADMEGELFTYDEQPDAASGTVATTLRNATESPLRIEALPVWLRRDGIDAQAMIDGLDLSSPVTLAPDATVSITVRATQPLVGGGPIDAIFDLGQVRAQPDPDKILPLILDKSVNQEVVRPVKVETALDLLGEGASPDQSIRRIVVEFRGNRRVELDSDHLVKEVEVPIPLLDVLLRRNTEGTYSYRQIIIYKSNRQVVDQTWRQGDLSFLFVPVA